MVVLLVAQHRGPLRRDLVDTAVTRRGGRLVVVVGQPNALADRRQRRASAGWWRRS